MSGSIIFGPKGKPWSEKKVAFKHLCDNALSDYCVLKHAGGWILSLTSTLEPEPTKIAKSIPMTYKRVRFNPRTDRSEPNQVVLSVNDIVLCITRGKETILPESHLEAARHCTHRAWFYDDVKSEMVDNGYIMKYPYQDLGESTLEEYNEFLKSGNAKRDKDLASA